jgi:type IV fimbrial biogenesis protein FimT
MKACARAPFVTTRWQRGVTLIELLITLAIVAILVVIGFPSMQQAFRTNRVSTFSNELLAAAAYARSEAVRRRGNVVLCASPNPTADGSDPAAAAATCDGTEWHRGWIVFVDLDGDGQRQSTEQVLRVGEARDGITATASDEFVINYGRLGLANLVAAQTIDVRSTPCEAGRPARRLVGVSVIGRLGVDPDIRFCP